MARDIDRMRKYWKLDYYLDSSGKIKQVSVASLKFMIMMQACRDNENKRIHYTAGLMQIGVITRTTANKIAERLYHGLILGLWHC